MGSQATPASQYMDVFKQLFEIQNRDEKNALIVKRIGRIQQEVSENKSIDEFHKTLLGFFESEWDHQYLVCTALRRIRNKRRHDWSKDYAYIFILAGKFSFKIDDEHYLAKWNAEVERHYKLEPHHQKHATLGGTINKLDIEEMAIDQLSRSIYRNKGVIDADNMKRFLPTFHGEDAAEKLQWFQECVAKHTDLMKDVYGQYMEEENDREQ